jgi:hypothetical protein
MTAVRNMMMNAYLPYLPPIPDRTQLLISALRHVDATSSCHGSRAVIRQRKEA